MNPNDLTEAIIGAAIEVHRTLGPGLLEAAYEDCLCTELRLRGICFERQKEIPLNYKGTVIRHGYRVDLVVEGTVIVELKAVEATTQLHRAQLLTYLKLGGWHVGLLINFNVPVLKDGLHRLVLDLRE